MAASRLKTTKRRAPNEQNESESKRTKLDVGDVTKLKQFYDNRLHYVKNLEELIEVLQELKPPSKLLSSVQGSFSVSKFVFDEFIEVLSRQFSQTVEPSSNKQHHEVSEPELRDTQQNPSLACAAVGLSGLKSHEDEVSSIKLTSPANSASSANKIVPSKSHTKQKSPKKLQKKKIGPASRILPKLTTENLAIFTKSLEDASLVPVGKEALKSPIHMSSRGSLRSILLRDKNGQKMDCPVVFNNLNPQVEILRLPSSHVSNGSTGAVDSEGSPSRLEELRHCEHRLSLHQDTPKKDELNNNLINVITSRSRKSTDLELDYVFAKPVNPRKHGCISGLSADKNCAVSRIEQITDVGEPNFILEATNSLPCNNLDKENSPHPNGSSTADTVIDDSNTLTDTSNHNQRLNISKVSSKLTKEISKMDVAGKKKKKTSVDCLRGEGKPPGRRAHIERRKSVDVVLYEDDNQNLIMSTLATSVKPFKKPRLKRRQSLPLDVVLDNENSKLTTPTTRASVKLEAKKQQSKSTKLENADLLSSLSETSFGACTQPSNTNNKMIIIAKQEQLEEPHHTLERSEHEPTSTPKRSSANSKTDVSTIDLTNDIEDMSISARIAMRARHKCQIENKGKNENKSMKMDEDQKSGNGKKADKEVQKSSKITSNIPSKKTKKKRVGEDSNKDSVNEWNVMLSPNDLKVKIVKTQSLEDSKSVASIIQPRPASTHSFIHQKIDETISTVGKKNISAQKQEHTKKRRGSSTTCREETSEVVKRTSEKREKKSKETQEVESLKSSEPQAHSPLSENSVKETIRKKVVRNSTSRSLPVKVEKTNVEKGTDPSSDKSVSEINSGINKQAGPFGETELEACPNQSEILGKKRVKTRRNSTAAEYEKMMQHLDHVITDVIVNVDGGSSGRTPSPEETDSTNEAPVLEEVSETKGKPNKPDRRKKEKHSEPDAKPAGKAPSGSSPTSRPGKARNEAAKKPEPVQERSSRSRSRSSSSSSNDSSSSSSRSSSSSSGSSSSSSCSSSPSSDKLASSKSEDNHNSERRSRNEAKPTNRTKSPISEDPVPKLSLEDVSSLKYVPKPQSSSQRSLLPGEMPVSVAPTSMKPGKKEPTKHDMKVKKCNEPSRKTSGREITEKFLKVEEARKAVLPEQPNYEISRLKFRRKSASDEVSTEKKSEQSEQLAPETRNYSDRYNQRPQRTVPQNSSASEKGRRSSTDAESELMTAKLKSSMKMSATTRSETKTSNISQTVIDSHPLSGEAKKSKEIGRATERTPVNTEKRNDSDSGAQGRTSPSSDAEDDIISVLASDEELDDCKTNTTKATPSRGLDSHLLSQEKLPHSQTLRSVEPKHPKGESSRNSSQNRSDSTTRSREKPGHRTGQRDSEQGRRQPDASLKQKKSTSTKQLNKEHCDKTGAEVAKQKESQSKSSLPKIRPILKTKSSGEHGHRTETRGPEPKRRQSVSDFRANLPYNTSGADKPHGSSKMSDCHVYLKRCESLRPDYSPITDDLATSPDARNVCGNDINSGLSLIADMKQVEQGNIGYLHQIKILAQLLCHLGKEKGDVVEYGIKMRMLKFLNKQQEDKKPHIYIEDIAKLAHDAEEKNNDISVGLLMSPLFKMSSNLIYENYKKENYSEVVSLYQVMAKTFNIDVLGFLVNKFDMGFLQSEKCSPAKFLLIILDALIRAGWKEQNEILRLMDKAGFHSLSRSRWKKELESVPSDRALHENVLKSLLHRLLEEGEVTKVAFENALRHLVYVIKRNENNLNLILVEDLKLDINKIFARAFKLELFKECRSLSTILPSDVVCELDHNLLRGLVFTAVKEEDLKLALRLVTSAQGLGTYATKFQIKPEDLVFLLPNYLTKEELHPYLEFWFKTRIRTRLINDDELRQVLHDPKATLILKIETRRRPSSKFSLPFLNVGNGGRVEEFQQDVMKTLRDSFSIEAFCEGPLIRLDNQSFLDYVNAASPNEPRPASS